MSQCLCGAQVANYSVVDLHSYLNGSGCADCSSSNVITKLTIVIMRFDISKMWDMTFVSFKCLISGTTSPISKVHGEGKKVKTPASLATYRTTSVLDQRVLACGLHHRRHEIYSI